MIGYVVTEPFAFGGTRYARGALISDPAVAKEVAAQFPRHVMRRNVADPKPVEAPAPHPEER